MLAQAILPGCGKPCIAVHCMMPKRSESRLWYLIRSTEVHETMHMLPWETSHTSTSMQAQHCHCRWRASLAHGGVCQKTYRAPGYLWPQPKMGDMRSCSNTSSKHLPASHFLLDLGRQPDCVMLPARPRAG